MKEPLLWNTLDEAAIWLAEATGESWTVRQVLNAVIVSNGSQGDLMTPLRAAPPLGTEFGVYDILGGERGSDAYPLRRRLGWRMVPIHLNAAKLILACGECNFSYVDPVDRRNDDDSTSPGECVWVMPFGTELRVNLSMLGISHNDLKALAEQLKTPVVVPHYVGFRIGAPPSRANPVPSNMRILPPTIDIEGAALINPPVSKLRWLPPDTEQDQDVPADITGADNEIALLFDGVSPAALDRMFPCTPVAWSSLAERASRNGLEVARTGRGKFNPLQAAQWWLAYQKPREWDWARCLRVLANNLPPRSNGLKHRLTGDYD
jgi:hypothetical protein